MSDNDKLPVAATDAAAGSTADPSAAAFDPRSEAAIDGEHETVDAGATDGDSAADTAAATPRRSGWFLRLIALLFWLLIVILAAFGAAGAGWIFWERFQHDDPASQQAAGVAVQIGDITSRLNEIALESQRIASSVGDLRSELDGTASQVDTLGQRLRRELSQLRDSGPPSERDWRLAEVEYLLRIANIRLRMERDAPGTRRLLQSADDLLAELDDYSLLDVRAAVAEDIGRITALPGLDVDGLFLQLQALKNSITSLPLAAVSYGIAPPPEPEAEPPSVAWRVLRELTGVVSIRTDLDRPVQPLLTAEEAWYLEQNLRLMYEQAQIALLRGADTMYHESLRAARDWLVAYYDSRDNGVQAALATVDTLDEAQLLADLPDISGSLNRLLAARAKARAGKG